MEVKLCFLVSNCGYFLNSFFCLCLSLSLSLSLNKAYVHKLKKKIEVVPAVQLGKLYSKSPSYTIPRANSPSQKQPLVSASVSFQR